MPSINNGNDDNYGEIQPVENFTTSPSSSLNVPYYVSNNVRYGEYDPFSSRIDLASADFISFEEYQSRQNKERQERENKIKDLLTLLDDVKEKSDGAIEMVYRSMQFDSIVSQRVNCYIADAIEIIDSEMDHYVISSNVGSRTLAEIYCRLKSGDDAQEIYDIYLRQYAFTWTCGSCQDRMRENQSQYNTRQGEVCAGCWDDFRECARCSEYVHLDHSTFVDEWDAVEEIDEDTASHYHNQYGSDIDLCDECFAELVENILTPEERRQRAEDRRIERERQAFIMQNPIPRKGWDCSKSHATKSKGDTIISSRLWSCEIEHYSTDRLKAVEVYRNMPDGFGISGDGSLNTCGKVSNGKRIDAPVEIQTSLLGGKKGEQTIRDFCKKLQQADSYVDHTCGLHVHIDLRDIIDSDKKQIKALKNILVFYILYEDCISKFLPANRRTNRFAKAIKDGYSISKIKAKSDTNLQSFMGYWYGVSSTEDLHNCLQQHYQETRYYGINLHAFWQHQNIEVRHHSGTLNAQKIIEWVNLHTAIIDYCVREDVTIDTIERDFDALKNDEEKKQLNKFFDIIKISLDSRNYFFGRVEKFRGSAQTEFDMSIPDKKMSSLPAENNNQEVEICVG